MDAVVLIVNHPEYGGAGGIPAVYSVGGDPRVAIHEPDPATLPPAGTVGFFDGAYYYPHHGIYRPEFTCLMNDFEADNVYAFCAVSQQAIRTAFYTTSPLALPCFIASAIYGDPAHPDVVALRRWRYRHLRQGARGRTAMRLLSAAYQEFGPVLARVTRRHPRLRSALRRGLLAPSATLLRCQERHSAR